MLHPCDSSIIETGGDLFIDTEESCEKNTKVARNTTYTTYIKENGDMNWTISTSLSGKPISNTNNLNNELSTPRDRVLFYFGATAVSGAFLILLICSILVRCRFAINSEKKLLSTDETDGRVDSDENGETVKFTMILPQELLRSSQWGEQQVPTNAETTARSSKISGEQAL